MKIALLSAQFIISILLIVFILLHSAKGEGLGSIGGQARLFSSQKDMESGLNKITAIFAGLFIGIALILSIIFS